jgi:hypothetical protein
MKLSFDFRNNVFFDYAVIFIALKYVIRLNTLEFDSSNHLGEGEVFNCRMIVSTIGNNFELSLLFVSSFTRFSDCV